MSEIRRKFFYRETDGIRITVRPTYHRLQSRPELGQFCFAYHIRIENVSRQAAQLRTRRWLIHDPIGGDNVVEGDGVVGVQPHLLVGQVHEYTSFCVIQSSVGWMEGAYRFVRDDGSSFLADVPRFALNAEPQSDTAN